MLARIEFVLLIAIKVRRCLEWFPCKLLLKVIDASVAWPNFLRNIHMFYNPNTTFFVGTLQVIATKFVAWLGKPNLLLRSSEDACAACAKKLR
jgi:hypothetical protein